MFSASPFFKTLQKAFADVWFMPVWGRGGKVMEESKKNLFSYYTYTHNLILISIRYFPQKGKQNVIYRKR